MRRLDATLAAIVAALALCAVLAFAFARLRQRADVRRAERKRQYLSRPYACPASALDRQFYFVRAHKYDVQLASMWEEMACEFPPDRLFMLFDDSAGTMADEFMREYGHRVLLHTADSCKREVHPNQKDLWYHIECPYTLVYDFLRDRYPWFSYAWVIESDVYCDGSWRRALAKADGMREDLLAVAPVSWESLDAKGREWDHWDHVEGELERIPKRHRWRAFIPVARFSPGMLALVKASIGHASGYAETYIASLAIHNGKSVAQLPHSMFGQFNAGVAVRGSLVPDRRDDRLYHKFELYD